MPELWQACLIVCPLVFMAGFVDSVAGGGGIISIPAYMLAGLPTHLSTVERCVCIGTALASVKYWKNGCVKARIAGLGPRWGLWRARTRVRIWRCSFPNSL